MKRSNQLSYATTYVLYYNVAMDPSTFTDKPVINSNSNNPSSTDPGMYQMYDSTKQKGLFDRLGGSVIDFIQTFVVFAAIFALIYLFAAQPHRVSGQSMFPTFHNNDYILTDKISYRLHAPNRGDVVVFKNPRDESQDFIKRIIGIPGDTVMVSNSQVFVNGALIDEYYLPPDAFTRNGAFLIEGATITVAPDTLIVFGDNREHSSDSREWGFMPYKDMIGRVFFRYWPPSVFGFFKALP